MDNNILSDEEINSLMSKDGTGTDNAYLSDEEKDAIGEISNISMGTSATTLSSLVNLKVDISTPVVSIINWAELANSYDKPCVFIQIYYKEGLDGNNILVLKEADVKAIADLMMGGDGKNISGELSELHLSAICEAMNQMMGSASTSISSMLETKVDISPPQAQVVDFNTQFDDKKFSEFLSGDFVKVSFRMVIEDLVDSELMQLYPIEFAKNLYSKFVKETEKDMQPQQINGAAQQPTPQAPQMQQGMPTQGMPMQGMPMMQGMQGAADVNISPAQFQPFMQMQSPLLTTENIDLLLDVPLEVTVELGRTSKTIKDILDFAPGTIVELNRLAGEPIDVLVNGKYVAKGEVVVIEEAFGIRITDVIK